MTRARKPIRAVPVPQKANSGPLEAPQGASGAPGTPDPAQTAIAGLVVQQAQLQAVTAYIASLKGKLDKDLLRFTQQLGAVSAELDKLDPPKKVKADDKQEG